MHIPIDYKVTDKAVIEAFIQQHPFGQLVCAGDHFPVINHLPFLYNIEEQYLWGHLAKQNPGLKLLDNAPVSVVFSGPHGYISPDWYEKPGVPTWNYQAVHITGTCHLDSSAKAVQQMVDELSTFHQESLGFSWNADYNPKLLSAIVALKIDIHEIHCQFKLSQDRNPKDQQNVMKALSELGQHDLSQAMKEYETKD